MRVATIQHFVLRMIHIYKVYVLLKTYSFRCRRIDIKVNVCRRRYVCLLYFYVCKMALVLLCVLFMYIVLHTRAKTCLTYNWHIPLHFKLTSIVLPDPVLRLAWRMIIYTTWRATMTTRCTDDVTAHRQDNARQHIRSYCKRPLANPMCCSYASTIRRPKTWSPHFVSGDSRAIGNRRFTFNEVITYYADETVSLKRSDGRV